MFLGGGGGGGEGGGEGDQRAHRKTLETNNNTIA